ncbi:MAG: amidohydrolase family protein, partial [Chloroflexota bacterium]
MLASCERNIRVTAIPGTPRPIPTLPPGSQADLILVNGNVVIMDNARTTAQAVAITGDKILATGSDEAIRALALAQTQVIDLGGRTVTPGLIDAHCHLSACGLLGTAYLDVSWPAINTIEQLQEKVAEKVAQTPAGEWIVGAGWVTFGGRYPNKHDLDPVSPNHPVMLINMGGHMAVVNSLALEMAGVTADTPDPGN